MAKYVITFGHGGDTNSTRTFKQRPAAYRFAYARWYEALGYLGGRDTQWGRAGATALDAWLIDRTSHTVTAIDPHGTFAVIIKKA